jgi:phosphatidate cytidylyltransferase
MSFDKKSLVTRTLSGAALMVVFFGAIYCSRWSFGALVLAMVLGCQYEFYRMCRAAGNEPQQFAGLVLGAALAVMSFVVFMQFGGDEPVGVFVGKMVYTLGLYMLLLVPTIFICEMVRNRPTPIANVATTFAGVMYAALPLALLFFVPLLLGGGDWNPWIMLGYILIVWSNDVFAYLVGCAIGRHRMCERISPKKSWEGFVGGVVGAIAIGVGVAWLLGGDLILWGGMSAVVAVTGVAGDFVESMFKRSVGVKDSGAMLPGHGGWLDRFDALLISSPFVFAYLLIML